jgi:ATP-dependent Clp protease adaptor protein ClpS
MGTDPKQGEGAEVLERSREREKTEDLWKVVLHNDDYTPMDFVVDVLEEIFDLDSADAFRVMMQVHEEGRGIAGVFPHEVAETKAEMTIESAREAGHPLLASVEEA